MFIKKLSLIDKEEAKWMQYTGYTYSEEAELLCFNFKTSNLAISFSISMTYHEGIYGKPFFLFQEVYDFFKDVKYAYLESLKPQ